MAQSQQNLVVYVPFYGCCISKLCLTLKDDTTDKNRIENITFEIYKKQNIK